MIVSTGTGKTATLKTYWEAFRMQPDPFSASDTTFTLTKHMSSSCSVPVWIDEYKPADIDDRRLDKLHRRLREVTKGTLLTLKNSRQKKEIGDAFEHLASNIGKQGKRRGYNDIFLELFSQAASAGYLEQNIDFKFYTSSKHGDEVLSLHMPSAYADVKRYARGYNLSDEYNIIGKSDYVSALADKSGNDSHILALNHVVRLNGGRAEPLFTRNEQKNGWEVTSTFVRTSKTL